MYEGRIRLVVKHYPYAHRDFSQLAAEASLAAKDQGKFWEMHRTLLRNSPRLDRDSLVSYAREIGLDIRRFLDSLDRKAHAAAIRRDVDLAVSLDLYNTPTFFLNGRMIVGYREYDYMKKAVDDALKAAKR